MESWQDNMQNDKHSYGTRQGPYKEVQQEEEDFPSIILSYLASISFYENPYFTSLY